jgi:spore germination protein YaaH
MHKNDWGAARASLITNGNLIAEVSPAWYEIHQNGHIAQRTGSFVNDPVVVQTAKQNGMLLRPLLMNVTGAGSNPELVMPILRDPAKRSAHVAEIRKLVADNNYDGIDLDYEGIEASDLDDLASLVEELALALHTDRKTLGVSIDAFGGEAVLPAWERIGEAADNVRLMAYGYKSRNPGPVVDLTVMREQLGRALRAIPAHKLTHGIPTYCHVWEDGNIETGTWDYLLKPQLNKKIVVRDSTTQTPWYTSGSKHVWCEDAESVKTKMAIGQEFGITHFALWRIGAEDPRIWEAIASF